MEYLDLLTYVGADLPDVGEQTLAQRCWDEASVLVSAFVGEAEVPAAIIDRATLETAAELFHRRNAPNGITQFATFDGGSAAVRVARDPMTGAYPLLRQWVVTL